MQLKFYSAVLEQHLFFRCISNKPRGIGKIIELRMISYSSLDSGNHRASMNKYVLKKKKNYFASVFGHLKGM